MCMQPGHASLDLKHDYVILPSQVAIFTHWRDAEGGDTHPQADFPSKSREEALRNVSRENSLIFSSWVIIHAHPGALLKLTARVEAEVPHIQVLVQGAPEFKSLFQEPPH